MASPKDKFNQAIDKSIKQGLEQRQNILSELVEDMHNQKNTMNEKDIEMEEKNEMNSQEPVIEENPDQQQDQNQNDSPPSKETSKKKESRLTGSAPASWNVPKNDSWQKFSPTAKSKNENSSQKSEKTMEKDNTKNNNEINSDNKKEGNMKRILSLIILVGAIAVFLYYWAPWQSGSGMNTTIQFSQASFSTGTPEKTTTFTPQSEIFYMISQNQAFNAKTIEIEIYKVANNKETLFRTQTENNIDPQANSFTYMLRPDFFKDSGTYNIKIFIGQNKNRKLATEKTLTIK